MAKKLSNLIENKLHEKCTKILKNHRTGIKNEVTDDKQAACRKSRRKQYSFLKDSFPEKHLHQRFMSAEFN